jgi:hypothetical protein
MKKKTLLKERLQQLAGIKPLYQLNEQSAINPFAGGTGPNWQAASQAWQNWNATNQGGAPQPPSAWIAQVQGRGCNFYQARLTAQVDSFIQQFGGQLGGTASSNPAWQSQKYAKIMWLANKVRITCTGGGTPPPSPVTCINDWIDDPANDAVLVNATCANGNPAISP